MSKRNLHPDALVVVCDGHKAMVLEDRGGIGTPDLRMREVLEHEEFPTRAMGTAAPGRVHQSVGPCRSAVAQTDWHDEAERGFLVTLAHHLDVAVSRDPARITLVAAPRALGMLRKAYSPTLRQAISEEVGKDWVNMPIPQIEQHLRRTKSQLH
jgi:protein required for attachment to host cells